MTRLEQDPCGTCGYEEGSIYCKEHCPHEAKIEQESSGDAISRKLVYAFLFGLISDDAERKKALEYINELPPVSHQETVTEFADRCRECGREKVLDKIRAEIKTMSGDIETIADVLKIIDKYKT